jgi:2-polyprenyl-3-methyl-5-hydroxy-6-metoxy-1,4-benzoquinol methylase
MSTYRLRQQSITVNQLDYPLSTLLDRQQFSDDEQVAEKLGISSATWSLFGVVWPGARMLAGYLAKLDLTGKRVLEIGCGIGLSSLVLHRMGVDITASDYHPLAQEFLDRNVLASQLPPIKYLVGNWTGANPLLGEFDLIIGSDVLYEPAHPAQVSGFIDRHMAVDGAVLILDPNRGNRSQFTRAMLALGYLHHFEHFHQDGEAEVRCRGRYLHYQRSLSLVR